MLFIAIVFILFVFYVFHVTKLQLIKYLEKGEVEQALKLLRTMDMMSKDD